MITFPCDQSAAAGRRDICRTPSPPTAVNASIVPPFSGVFHRTRLLSPYKDIAQGGGAGETQEETDPRRRSAARRRRWNPKRDCPSTAGESLTSAFSSSTLAACGGQSGQEERHEGSLPSSSIPGLRLPDRDRCSRADSGAASDEYPAGAKPPRGPRPISPAESGPRRLARWQPHRAGSRPGSRAIA